MINLEELLKQIDQLNLQDFEQVKTHVVQKRPATAEQHTKPTPQQMEEWMHQLHQAIAEFKQGLTEKELEDILWVMDYKGNNVPDIRMFDWIDDLPEDER